MEFLRKIFKKEQSPTEKDKEDKVEQPKKEINLIFSEIQKDPEQIYFTISGDNLTSIQLMELKKIYLEVTPRIRKNFGIQIENSENGIILKFVFYTRDNQEIENFEEIGEKLLTKIKSDLESKFK
ncbi:MAG: hypothetical protein KatS3mg094_224 [Candidatus Parcubacteria bacterium]|nr:MAG: hypothetical protein KatS3mg094_224 [Candidatus Parcubacteria bacterium]